MCGIAGVFGLGMRRENRDSAVAGMLRTMCHRGPDDEGVHVLRGRADEDAGSFAHRRLSILDLSPLGHQPMLDSASRLTIVFNGEIYNYRVLREALAADGARFRSGSDTEVILEGWARHGPAFLGRLRGMFAFALWDSREGQGYLVRDPFGIKPLYVARVDGGVAFASELRALLATRLVARTIDADAIAGYLAQGAIPEPLTAIAGVSALPAGTVATITMDSGTASIGEPTTFARTLEPVPTGDLERDADRAARLVRETLSDSVEHHLVSDVPVALFLSGGIDSSAVVALASQRVSTPLRTFTITFDEARYSEAGPAQAVARAFRTEHQEIPLGVGDLLESLPSALSSMDQPSLDGLNTFAVSAAVRRAGYKVVLSGLGGDEMFAGYPAFQRARSLSKFWGTTAALRPVARGLASVLAGRRTDGDIRTAKLALSLGADDPARAAYIASRALYAGPLLANTVGHARADAAWNVGLDAPPAGLTLLQRVSWYELTGYMRNTLLRDSDVFSMAHGLELRVPFVDSLVARASMSVHDDLKLRRGVSKPLLVRALEGLLPREVWDRPKRGFELPFAEWLRTELRGEVASALLSPDRLARVGIPATATRTIWEGFLAGRPGLTWSRPWSLFTLVRWAEALDVSLADDALAKVRVGGARSSENAGTITAIAR